MKQNPPDVDKVLSSLKDFQRSTVDYVFQRLYLDGDDCANRFLIADEVGLGKTLVAKGVIARAVDYLWGKRDRIDIIYVCSNQEIASQNIDRLNISSGGVLPHATRATLLALSTKDIQNQDLNFISLTPNTSFRLDASTGWARERILLYHLLKENWADLNPIALSTILRGSRKSERTWSEEITWMDPTVIDPGLKHKFFLALTADVNLRSTIDNLINHVNCDKRVISDSIYWPSIRFVSHVRNILAKSSLNSLEPDLIILDEFQRFKDLLEGQNEASVLANELFNYPDAKVLLLSATPYKMYTIYGEENEDHFEDFRKTMNFLLDGKTEDKKLLFDSIGRYRYSFINVGINEVGHQNLRTAKQNIETILRKVMVRTERLAISEHRNGMLTESNPVKNLVQTQDILSFVLLDRIARSIGAMDQVEYWKSSPYPLNLMENYQLKKKFDQSRRQPTEDLINLIGQAEPYLLHWNDFQEYRSIDPGNARLRALIECSLTDNQWKLLWLPPSLPYYAPSGVFVEAPTEGITKSLVFSAWKIVPKVIAVMLGYLAEQSVIAQNGVKTSYEDLSKKARLLEFDLQDGRPSGMSVLSLIYPCQSLALEIDPLAVSKEQNADMPPASYQIIGSRTLRLKIKSLLEQATASISTKGSGQVDERWYWAAPLLIDRKFNREVIEKWLFSPDWENLLNEEEDKKRYTHFRMYVSQARDIFRNPEQLGRKPPDLEIILRDIALGSPAVCALRGLLRVTDTKETTIKIINSAARSAFGFRTLFNQPDAITLLQNNGSQKAYWRVVLDYCFEGNLQSVLDEYFHVLYESLGVMGHDPDTAAEKISAVLRTVVGLRAPSLRFDDIRTDNEQIYFEQHRIRCRYALRFGDEQSEEDNDGLRSTDVRLAFNSPFRPFVLATTSLGQEGLDFHQFCHRVVHWNLPTNPVDLEQREGRVHRYKCHVIRRNLATNYGYRSIEINQDQWANVWNQLFAFAVRDRKPEANDLVPYWIYEGGKYKIERQIPLLPFSSEIGRLKRLKNTLVAYRSVIGQARQEELLETLSSRLSLNEIATLTKEFMIDLSPSNIS